MPGPSDIQARQRSGATLALGMALALVAVVLATGPLWMGPYWMRVMSAVFMLAVIAQGLNLMAGYTGYPAFGNVAFFGLGGYLTAILMVKAALPFWLAAPLATLACPLLALLLGPVLLRIKGHYFAIATLGLNEATRELVANGGDLTGGGTGLSLPLPEGGPVFNAIRFYYLFLTVMVLSLALTHAFARSHLGLGCQAIRDNETKAEASGLFTMRYKTTAWMLSATMTGAVGAIQAWWVTYIDPAAMFDMALAVKAYAGLLLGGAGTVLGPVAGAFGIELLANLTWSRLLNWHLGAMGVVVMLIVLLFPQGVARTLRRPYGLLHWGRHRGRSDSAGRRDEA
jgi:branched-chain amino acid transport system permease protein